MTSQKEYLMQLESKINLGKPIFIDRTTSQWNKVNPKIQIWAIVENDFVHAYEIKNDNIVGRYRIDDSNNSGIYELWFELDSSKELQSKDAINDEWKFMANAGKKLLASFEEFGITEEYVYIKSSGRGLHFHVFCQGFKGETQYKQTLKTIMHISGVTTNIKQSQAKSVAWGFDGPAITSSRRKVRAFGAENTKLLDILHYCSLVPDLRGKKYPFITKPEKVIYPQDIKIFKIDKKFIHKLFEHQNSHFFEETVDKTKTKVNYERTGDVTLLTQCPTIKKIVDKADRGEHIVNSERLMLLQTYGFYGENGKKAIHSILAKDTGDYSESYTDMQIQNMMTQNRKPITCKWIKENVRCPAICKGIKNKTPAMLAWTPPTLENLRNEIAKHIRLQTIDNKTDFDLIDIILAMGVERSRFPDANPLWIFLIAPSGGGKTEILLILNKWNQVYTIDELTKASFISGLYPDKKLGILEDICNHTVVVKDMTQILTSNKDERNAIFGVFRNAYDGMLEKGFGTKKGKISLDSKFGLLIGITPIIDAYWSLLSQLGERFLKVRFRCREDDVLEKIFAQDMNEFIASREKLQGLVREYLSSLTFSNDIELPVKYKSQIKDLVQLVATIRTSIWNKGEGDTRTFIGTREIASRLLIQTKKLWTLLCDVRKKNRFTQQEMNTIARVLLQTPPLDRMLIFYYLSKKTNASTNEISHFMRSTHYSIDHTMNQLVYLRIVKTNSFRRWELTDKYKNLVALWLEKGWLEWILRAREDYGREGRRHTKDSKNMSLDDEQLTIDEVKVAPSITILDSDVEANSGCLKIAERDTTKQHNSKRKERK